MSRKQVSLPIGDADWDEILKYCNERSLKIGQWVWNLIKKEMEDRTK